MGGRGAGETQNLSTARGPVYIVSTVSQNIVWGISGPSLGPTSAELVLSGSPRSLISVEELKGSRLRENRSQEDPHPTPEDGPSQPPVSLTGQPAPLRLHVLSNTCELIKRMLCETREQRI